MAALGSITMTLSPGTSINLTGYNGIPPEGALELNRQARSGVSWQDYMYGGTHGVQGNIQISFDATTAAARAIVYASLLTMRGSPVVLVLGEDTFTGWMFLNVMGAPELITMSVAAGGVTGGKYLARVNISLERIF